MLQFVKAATACARRQKFGLHDSTFITINLAPADLKKEGSGFDLPIALGILGAYGGLRVSDLSNFPLVGELGLDGSVRPIPGMLPVAIWAHEKKIKILILPAANASEAAVVEGVNVFPVSSLTDVIELLNSSVIGVVQREPFRVNTQQLLGELQQFTVDFLRPAGTVDGKACARSCRGEQAQNSDQLGPGIRQDHAGEATGFDSGADDF